MVGKEPQQTRIGAEADRNAETVTGPEKTQNQQQAQDQEKKGQEQHKNRLHGETMQKKPPIRAGAEEDE